MKASAVTTKVQQIAALLFHSKTPYPLVLDSLRMRQRPYVAKLRNGATFALEAGRGDWFTLYECGIRMDYFSNGIALSPGDTVIDIGANFGAFAVEASRRVGPTGKVYCFEPNPDTFRRLQDNIQRNACSNVSLYNEAVSDRDGQIEFYVYDKSAYSSLYESVDARQGGWRDKIVVPTRALSSVISEIPARVDLLKVDCEGAEHAMFETADRADLRSVVQIVMELHEVPGKSIADLKHTIRDSGFITHEAHPFVALRNAT